MGGTWEFRPEDDSGASSGWKSIGVPANWEAQGFRDYDGVAWYRKMVTVPKSWKNRDWVLVLGGVDDHDWTFWNRRLIGHSTVWNSERRYKIPRGIARSAGSNLILIRVLDTAYGGGIWKLPVRIEMLP